MEPKNILVTGGAGYVGVTLVEELLKKYPYSNVIVLDNLSKGRIENLSHLIHSNKNLIFEIADLRDYEKIELILKKYSPEIVVHLAAIVDAFSTNRKGKDEECMDVNYTATVKFAELCKENKVKTFIFQSTVSLYSQGQEIKEDSEKNPISIYGKAKLKAEQEILALNSPIFQICSLRPATLVGYNQAFRYETIINLSCIRSINNIPLQIFESAIDGEKTYLTLKDNAKAIIFSIAHINVMQGQSYNLTSFNTGLRKVIDLLKYMLQSEIPYEIINESNVSQQVYTINSDKLKSLGFIPEGNLEQTIRETVSGILLNKDSLKLHFVNEKELNLEVINTKIQGLIEIIPKTFIDERGFFLETFNLEDFSKLGLPTSFVQDNQSISKKGVLRGLHLQKHPFSQGKLVRVSKGSVLDVAVDLRENSDTYGQWHSLVLSDKNQKMLYISEGFAHGFLVLEDNTIFNYKCTNYYNKEYESGICWDDKKLKIDWQLYKYGIDFPIVSEKDKDFPSFIPKKEKAINYL